MAEAIMGSLVLLVALLIVIWAWRAAGVINEDDQQKRDYRETVARLILARQEGQIPHEKLPVYLEVAKAIDEYRAGKWKGDGNVCIACGQSCGRPSGDPITDLFCRTHVEIGLMLWVSTAIDERLRGNKPRSPGRCIACDLAFDPCGDEMVDDFCGWHVEPGLKLGGYFEWKSKNPDGVAA